MTIDRFVGDYAFLSNFYSSTIFYKNKSWKTVEHVYQAHKTLDEKQQELIRCSNKPSDAKKLGQLVIIRHDWDEIKFNLMKEFVHLKFENIFLRHLLLQTGDQELIESNFWNDKYWGVCRGVGENKLGIILMEERKNIKEEINEKD